MNGLQRISRREFLQRTGQAGGGLVFALAVGQGCSRTPEPGTAPVAGPDSFMPNVYVNIRTDGIVEIICHRSEMGQGIRTCLPQVIADELDADWERIELKQALGDEKYGDQNTDGSTSIRRHFDLLRGAGATAREMLVAAAAADWGVPASECVTRDHAVHHEASGRSAGYGDLVALTDGIAAPETPTFKDPANYRYIGKSLDTIDGFAMSVGTANYGIDATLPGMLHASIERCPTHGGAVASFDATAAKAVAGVVDVIKLPDPEAGKAPGFLPLGGVAVLATNTWSAMQGRAALTIEWAPGANGAYDSEIYREELLASAGKEGKTVLERGDAAAALAAAFAPSPAALVLAFLMMRAAPGAASVSVFHCFSVVHVQSLFHAYRYISRYIVNQDISKKIFRREGALLGEGDGGRGRAADEFPGNGKAGKRLIHLNAGAPIQVYSCVHSPWG